MKPACLLTALAALLIPLRVVAQAPAGAPGRADMLNARLFLAITDHNAAAVQAALQAGADPNRRNWLGITPLDLAAYHGDRAAVTMLLHRGARVNEGSIYGSALTFAALGRQDAMGRYLMDRGVAPSPSRVDGATPLMVAASNGNLSLLQRLLARKMDPDRRDIEGATALIFAARRGQTATARMLLKAGARVDMADQHGRTALMYAAANGYPALVDLLIGAKASVQRRDRAGATPLLLAARYSGDAGIVQSLLRAGASAQAKDASGRTAGELAAARGYRTAARMLGMPASSPMTTASYSGEMDARRSAQRAIQRVESGMRVFADKAGCVSCHHQGVGLMTLGRARQHGLAVAPDLVESYIQRIAKEGESGGAAMHAALSRPEISALIPGVDIGDFSFGAAYFMNALDAGGIPANPGMADLAQFLGTLQKPDGAWRFGMNRGTMQNTNVTTTALALRALEAYWPADRAEAKARVMTKALAWLRVLQPRNAEERAARLLGMKSAGADPAMLQQAVNDLLAAQKPDGGWGAKGAARSDAYTTGISLFALRTAGALPASDPAVRRGAAFLVRTQDEDGSWYVPKSTPAYNNHFDGGFPHGYSQYASFAGTCWAAMGLMETLDPAPAPVMPAAVIRRP